MAVAGVVTAMKMTMDTTTTTTMAAEAEAAAMAMVAVAEALTAITTAAVAKTTVTEAVGAVTFNSNDGIDDRDNEYDNEDGAGGKSDIVMAVAAMTAVTA